MKAKKNSQKKSKRKKERKKKKLRTKRITAQKVKRQKHAKTSVSVNEKKAPRDSKKESEVIAIDIFIG